MLATLTNKDLDFPEIKRHIRTRPVSNDNKQTTVNKLAWRKAFDLIKDYFINSDEKLIAWLLLIGAVLCMIGACSTHGYFCLVVCWVLGIIGS